MTQPPWDKAIEDAAAKSNPNDANTVGAVFDAIANYPRPNPQLPASALALVKSRLVQAEIAYRQGQGPGVQEQGVVDAVNLLAQKFAAPDYTNTSQKQVRFLRMSLALGEPQFMGKGMASAGAKIGDSVNSEMSPLQAAHVMDVLITQKFVNPDFQVPPDVWDQTSYQPGMEKLQALEAARKAGAPRTYGATARTNPHRQEMDGVFTQGLQSMNTTDGFELLDAVMAKLGIN